MRKLLAVKSWPVTSRRYALTSSDVTRWRVQKASRLLKTSPAGVVEVAKRVGYDAEAAFSKAFKRWIGVAPGAYRRRAGVRSRPHLRSTGELFGLTSEAFLFHHSFGRLGPAVQ